MWALDERRRLYDETGETLKPSKFYTIMKERRNSEEDYHLKRVYSQVLNDVAVRLDEAYSAFFRRAKQGKEKAGFPKYPNRDKYTSFIYPIAEYRKQGYKIDREESKLTLSMIGDIKVKFHRPLPDDVRRVAISRKADKYYACFLCDVPKEQEVLPVTGGIVGIDVGIKSFLVTSDGEFVDPPNYYRESEEKLKRLQKDVSRKKKGSNRRRKAVKQLAKLHEHVANQRKDFAYNEAKKLLAENDVVVHEDLNIKGMVKNHHLAKSISDAGWGSFLQKLDSKAQVVKGKEVIKVDPRNTTQRCSRCFRIVKKDLSVRVHECPYCGLVLDRDINAAINIMQKATMLPLSM